MSIDSAQELIDRDRFDKWQISLIYAKKIASSNEQTAERSQRQLEQVVESGPTAVRDYLLKSLGVQDRQEADRIVPSLPNPLTPAEMQRLPIHAEQKIAGCLTGITPAEATDPAFWTLCHAIWIGRWMFEEDVAAAFMVGSTSNTSERRARNFLRGIGGLNRVRGYTSVLEDCPISAAWWKCRAAEVASRAARDNGELLSVAKAHEVLWHNGVWKDNLARWSLKRVTVLSAPRVLAAVVSVLASSDLASKQGEAKQQVQAVMWAIARASHNYCVHYMPWNKLVGVAAEGLAQWDQVDVIDEAVEETE
ncbi:MAG: hypothetical protein OXE04_02565 [bacterium]|nr:hypothetical protein [bacterium]